jgi:nitrile hydratase accessory protein
LSVSEPQQEPVFTEPWQAQAFALTVALHKKGAFTWGEWTKALATAIETDAASPQDEDGSAYYRCWLQALERLVAEKGLVATPNLSARAEAWRRAAHATPHGAPILLANDPLAARG